MSPLLKKLLERGVITGDVLPGLDSLRADLGGTTPLNIVRAGLMSEDMMLDFICENFDIPAVLQFEMEQIPDDVIASVEQRVAEVHRAIPVELTDDVIEVAISDPTDLNALGAIKASSGRTVAPRVATESVLSWGLLRYYEIITPTIDEALGRKRITDSMPVASDLPDQKETVPEVDPDEESQDEPIQLTTVISDKQDDSRESAPEPEIDIEIEEGEVETPKERISFPVIETDEEEPAGPEMGNWEAPFELERTVSQPSSPPPGTAGSPETTESEVPAEQDQDEEEPREEEDETLLLVDEDDWTDAGAALEDEIESSAVQDEKAIIVEQETPRTPVVMMRNVVLGGEQSHDIIPPQPMTKRRAVEGISGPAARESSSPPPARIKVETLEIAPAKAPADEKTSSPVSQKKPAQKKPPPRRKGKIDPALFHEWTEAVQGLSTRDEVLDATLHYLEDAFGPAVFLARKGKGLAGWNGSPAFSSSIRVDVREIHAMPPTPREVWHALDRKRGMLGPISVKDEYPFLEGLMSPARTSILVIPVVIRNLSAGAFLCVLRDVWSASPQLRDTLESLGMVLSDKLELILRNRKKSKG